MFQVVGINGEVVLSPCFKYHVRKMLSRVGWAEKKMRWELAINGIHRAIGPRDGRMLCCAGPSL